MDRLQKLLTQVKHIQAKNRVKLNEKKKRGEYFNVFSVLGLYSEEVQLHSSFIAELLNSKGLHGAGTKFLAAFIKQLTSANGAEAFKALGQLDLANTTVEVEHAIGDKVDGANACDNTGARIDILLTDGAHSLIIENKIFAVLQPQQLTRYHNYGKQKYAGKFDLVYLTLYGSDPSEDSVTGLSDTDYISMSYAKDILCWLEDCAQIAYNLPLVRETINQYITIIKQLTSQDMDTEYKDELIKTLAKKENISAVLQIGELYVEAVKQLMYDNLLPQLSKIADKYKVQVEMNFDEYQNKTYMDIYFRSTKWSNKYIIFKTEYGGMKGLLWGFGDGLVMAIQDQLPIFGSKPCPAYQYGTSWIKEYSDLLESETIQKVVDGEFAAYIDRCLKELFSKYMDVETLEIKNQ